MLAWRYLGSDSSWKNLASHLALSGAVFFVYLSTRAFKKSLFFHWKDALIAAGLFSWSIYCAAHANRWPWNYSVRISEVEIAPALLLAYSSYNFVRLSHRHRSRGLYGIALSVSLWSVLVLLRPVLPQLPDDIASYSHFLGPLLQMIMGISLVTVVFEEERRVVQENLLAFSSLESDFQELVTPAHMEASMHGLLRRLLVLAGPGEAAIFILDKWRGILPHAQSGFSQKFLSALEEKGLGSALEAAPHPAKSSDSLIGSTGGLRQHQDAILKIAQQHSSSKLEAVTLLPLRSSDRDFGFLLFGRGKQISLASPQMSLLRSLSRQLGTTLDHYIQLHEARRRSKEYKLLAQIGQAISSRLNAEDVMGTIHRELGQIFDTRSFYIAFADGEEIHFEFECVEGEVLPKRSRRMTNGFTEHIIATGIPVLVRADMEKKRMELGLTTVGPKAKCFCGVPLFLNGRACGVMAALNYEDEFFYDERDLELLRAAAGQAVIAIENARTFQREQRRARDLAFLNNVSRIAIDRKAPAEMLSNIVDEMRRGCEFDHVSIGLLDYSTKEIVIQAEAGPAEHLLGIGTRMPLETGLMGLVARSNEKSIVRENAQQKGAGLLAASEAVICHPITYGDSLLGVLNVERFGSRKFSEEEVLVLGTLGDLLAAALQNAFSFQKMEHQSITDSLTALKTRRYFREALQSEWKRASRSGRPFSVLMMDLDKFKLVNDTKGHLEGDLVLARVGKVLEQKMRHSNVVARYGGDEFVVLLPETGLDQAQVLAERLRVWIASDPTLSERQITGSFGVSSFPLHGATPEEILAFADVGMYLSKRAGGNCVSFAKNQEESDDARQCRRLISTHLESFLQADGAEQRNPELLKTALRNLAEQVPAKMRRQTLMDALRLVCHALEATEDQASGHGYLVAKHCEAIGLRLQLSSEELSDLVFAAQIHDIGKVAIPLTILNKTGSLTPEEYAIVKKHPETGAEIASIIPDSERIQSFVRFHQEYVNGTGYPAGLKAEQIPMGARIINVAEAFAWVTVDRPFGSAKSLDAALTILMNASGLLFDRKVVDLFLKSIQHEGQLAAGI